MRNSIEEEKLHLRNETERIVLSLHSGWEEHRQASPAGKSRNASAERNGTEVGGRACFRVSVDGSTKSPRLSLKRKNKSAFAVRTDIATNYVLSDRKFY